MCVFLCDKGFILLLLRDRNRENKLRLVVHNVSFLPLLLLHTVLIFLPSVDVFAGFNARLLNEFMCVCVCAVCVCVCVFCHLLGARGREMVGRGGKETEEEGERH